MGPVVFVDQHAGRGFNMPTLTVMLKNISNLADEDHIGKSDPYVKFEIEKDGFFSDETVATAQSSKKKDEPNPEYNEEFQFTIECLDNRVLKLKVMDDDIGSDEKLGSGEIKLDDCGLNPGEPLDYELKVDDNWFSADAICYLTLTYEE